MQSKDEVLNALQEGKKLYSNVTGFHYQNINGKLHSKHSEKSEWKESELLFDFPPSWLNLS